MTTIMQRIKSVFLMLARLTIYICCLIVLGWVVFIEYSLAGSTRYFWSESWDYIYTDYIQIVIYLMLGAISTFIYFSKAKFRSFFVSLSFIMLLTWIVTQFNITLRIACILGGGYNTHSPLASVISLADPVCFNRRYDDGGKSCQSHDECEGSCLIIEDNYHYGECSHKTILIPGDFNPFNRDNDDGGKSCQSNADCSDNCLKVNGNLEHGECNSRIFRPFSWDAGDGGNNCQSNADCIGNCYVPMKCRELQSFSSHDYDSYNCTGHGSCQRRLDLRRSNGFYAQILYNKNDTYKKIQLQQTPQSLFDPMSKYLFNPDDTYDISKGRQASEDYHWE